MKKTLKYFKIVAILPFVLLLISCNPIENDSESTMILVIENLTGTDATGADADYVQSDVLTEDPNTGTSTIVSDIGIVSFKALFIDPEPVLGTSQFNSLTVTRYIVSYTRSDGNNREGIDVPYTFEGYLTVTLEANSTRTVSIVLVREVAKAEPPLINLREGRGEGVIEVTAKVDFYGHDMTNRPIKATGYISIFFANYITD